MNDTGTIYALECECSEKCKGRTRYVGQTINTKTRMRNHLSRKNATLVGEWVHSHGSRNIVMNFLEEQVPLGNLDLRERWWIKKRETFQPLQKGGLNLTEGGLNPKSEAELESHRIRNPPRGKLTLEDVWSIRDAYTTPSVTSKTLSAQYGVSVGCINDVVRNVTWPDESYTFTPRKRGGADKFDAATLTLGEVREIRESVLDETADVIASRYRVTPATIRRVIRNETWYDPGYIPRELHQGKNSPITQDKADRMRVEYAQGDLTYTGIAQKYGVTRSAAADILTNRTFKGSR